MLYRALELTVSPTLRAVYRPRVNGVDNVPRHGAVIIAGNHISFADEIFTPLTARRQVFYLAKAEYFTTPGIKGWFQKKFFSGSGQVPIDRTSGTAAAGAIKTQLRLLSEGEVCGIYPEGTRSHDGKLYRGRTGVARIALEAGVPVIPVAVINTDVVAPPGKIFGKFARPGVRFGQPLDFSRYEGMEGDRYILRAITDEIMYEIMRLSGQEYIDLYAQDSKKRDKELEREAAKAVHREESDEIWTEING